MKILYTAEAVVKGGRRGHGRTSDGRLEVDLSVPVAMDGDDGPGTNPEQLFALGYGSCFQSAMLGVARSRKLDASDSVITARVTIGTVETGGLGLAAALDLHAPHLARERLGLPTPLSVRLSLANISTAFLYSCIQSRTPMV